MSEPNKTNPRNAAALDAAESRIVTKRVVSEATTLSVRTIENLARAKRIPVIKISPRCVRFHLPSVLAALRRSEVQAITI